MSSNYNTVATATPRGGWRKSTYSDHGNACVEVNTDSDPVYIRDTKYSGNQSQQPVITVPADSWAEFLAAALGTHKGTTTISMPAIEHNELTGETALTTTIGTTLTYTKDEWDAFLLGIRDGEFSLPTSATRQYEATH